MVRRSIIRRIALMAALLVIMPGAMGRQKGIAESLMTSQSRMTLRILVCDQAQVETRILEEGQRIASLVYRQAGFDLKWLDGREHSVTEVHFVLRLHCCFSKLKSKLPERTAAFAPTGGRQVTIFWDRIKVEAASGSHDEGMLLGYVLAHEMGHLLLPAGYHSAYGIMQRRLDFTDLSRARRLRDLCFSEEEAGWMHAAFMPFLENQLTSAVSANR